ncbi:hypothetical protein GQ607_015585 [Colletotrichum asianum]|uniref:Uncharacterized protein n=1 Tax=Colletotrichum asianum TaxID=702518 RepID=A0A8H3VZG0_9PEZI|nr:hypothetical protein GQ607_015585 [Colletotrichum asianum]
MAVALGNGSYWMGLTAFLNMPLAVLQPFSSTRTGCLRQFVLPNLKAIAGCATLSTRLIDVQ